MVLLTTGFGEFEYSRTFLRASVEEKKCGKIQNSPNFIHYLLSEFDDFKGKIGR